jgi:hypothetical protein
MPLLSKTDFKVASTCPTKLYYRKRGYPDLKQRDEYLALLADGGYMVEELARMLHPDGIAIDTSAGHEQAAEQTRRLLADHPEVTLFEATFIDAGRLARVDILRKTGRRLDLMEVKCSLFDPTDASERRARTGSSFRSLRAPHGIMSKRREYLEDVTFQYALLRDVYPDAEITPYLVLVDKEHDCQVEGLAQAFRLTRRADGRLLDVEFTGDADAVRINPLTTAIDVSAEVRELEQEVRMRAAELHAALDPELVRVPPQLGRHCKDCEFDPGDGITPSGFHECWGAAADRPPLVLELYQGRDLIDRLIADGVFSLADLDQDRITGDGSYATRQRIQLDHTRTGTEWMAPELRDALEAATYPVHFVDFEAARLAVPHHRGMRPYGLRAFQWSCHTLAAPGGAMVHREWLNDDDPWPSRAFAETLRDVLGDEGSVVVWSPFEQTVLREIATELPPRYDDCADLADWLQRTASGGRILDLNVLCRDHYFHPDMGRRTSIKNVLDAIWRASPDVRQRFEEVEGYPGDPQLGPYAALPPIRIGDRAEVVADGGNAVRAYEAMMYGLERDDPACRAAWREVLLQYCRLDTLAMVLIWEHWMRVPAT